MHLTRHTNATKKRTILRLTVITTICTTTSASDIGASVVDTVELATQGTLRAESLEG